MRAFADWERKLKTFYVANGIYPASTAFIKLAILFQYLRVLERDSKMRKLTVRVIVVVFLWGVVFTTLAFVPW